MRVWMCGEGERGQHWSYPPVDACYAAFAASGLVGHEHCAQLRRRQRDLSAQ